VLNGCLNKIECDVIESLLTFAPCYMASSTSSPAQINRKFLASSRSIWPLW